MRMARRLSLAVVAALVGAGVTTLSTGDAQAASLTAVLVRTVDTSAWATPSPDPAGITYDATHNRLVLSDSEVDEMPLYQGRNVFLSTLDGQQTPGAEGWTTVPWSNEPAGVSYQTAGRFLVSDDDLDQVFLVDTGADGVWTPEDGVPASFTTRPLNGDPEDASMDMDATTNGNVLVIDGHGTDVYDYGPGPDGAFNGLPPAGDDTRLVFDVGQYGALDPEGIEYYPGRNTILVLDSESEAVYELDRQGRLLNVVSIAAGTPKSAAGITLAPPSNGSSGLNLYVVDRGVDNDSNPNENDGRFYEMALTLPPLGDSTNRAPQVSAGPDRSMNQSTSAFLKGTVSDDGLPDPPGTVAVTWSEVTGPGTVVFANPNAATTTATFTEAGTYVLRLTADDGDMAVRDSTTVVVSEAPPGGGAVFDAPVGAGTDDAEERSATTSVTGKDLELVVDGATVQTAGLRFPDVAVPPGGTVTRAYVQFSVDEATTGETSLTVAGQAADNPDGFTTAGQDISSRPRTAAAVGWTPVAWPSVGARGADQRTADLTPVVQEIVARPGWALGNALVLVITGNGTRTAMAWERGAGREPVLHIELAPPGSGPANLVPAVSAGPDLALTLAEAASLAGSVSDDGLPVPPGAVTAAWTTVSGPGPVVFADAAAASTTATFGAAGVYVLRLTGDDSALQAADEVTVTVTGVLDVPVAAGTDDAEERSASVSLTGTDLELVVDGTTVQTVGLRFAGVAVPAGATITRAYVQFGVDEASTAPTSLTVAGQAADNPAGFTAVSKNVSSRPRTTATVGWVPPAWPTRGARGADQQTPDLSAVVQEIVSRPGWVDGNAVALVITGSGTRTAAAFERGPAVAPVLHIDYRM